MTVVTLTTTKSTRRRLCHTQHQRNSPQRITSTPARMPLKTNQMSTCGGQLHHSALKPFTPQATSMLTGNKMATSFSQTRSQRGVVQERCSKGLGSSFINLLLVSNGASTRGSRRPTGRSAAFTPLQPGNAHWPGASAASLRPLKRPKGRAPGGTVRAGASFADQAAGLARRVNILTIVCQVKALAWGRRLGEGELNTYFALLPSPHVTHNENVSRR